MERTYQEETEEVFVLRKNNRVQRSVNKQLRRSLKNSQDQADSNFQELCETETESERALEKLWTLGELDCGPLDYDSIVALALEALGKQQAISQGNSSE
jgi:hypothetical protein